MEVIRNKDGEIVSRSRNLRGILLAVRKQLVKSVSIDRITGAKEMEPDGKLCVLFDNGDNFESVWSSYEILKDFVTRRWRNIKGAPLYINGVLQSQ